VQALLPAVPAVVLAVAMTWPLVLGLGSEVPQERDDPDPLYSVWHQAWIGHALREQPSELFQANQFWPERDSLAFADVILGYAPLAVAAEGRDAAVVVYDLVFLLTFVLAFLGAYLLARELGACRLAALVAGAAFAYAPYKLGHIGHLPVLSSGGIPLALFLLVRGYRRRQGWFVLAGWLVATWQVTLGFTLGVAFVYLLAAVGLVASLYWLAAGRPRLGRAVVGASAVGIAVLAASAFLQARPLLRVRDAHPEAARTFDEVLGYSPPLSGFVTASEHSLVWDGPTAGVRETLSFPKEEALFPGLVILVLAGLGLANRSYPFRLRLWLTAGIVFCADLSLGLREGTLTPYRVLYELAPGWDGLRTPGRIHTLTSLGLALLAAAGASLVLRAIRSRWRETAALIATGCLVTLVFVEGLGPTPLARVPDLPSGPVAAVEPELHLPSVDEIESHYTFWSIGGFPKLANGRGAFVPSRIVEIRNATADFPDANSVEYLRRLGIRTVILHPDLAAGTPWEDAARRPTRGLPLVREERGGVVLYELEPFR
jgi:hypothetical protein